MKLVAVMLAALLGSGCAGDDAELPAAVCGDSVCDLGETRSCQNDCYCRPGCGFLKICIMRLCKPDFQVGTYSVQLLMGRAESPRDDGSSWDADGPPDAYVTVSDGTNTIGTSGVIADSYQPQWNETLATVALTTYENLHFDVYDEDAATSELMFSCTTPVLSQVTDRTFHGFCNVLPTSLNQRIDFTLTLQ